MAETVINNKKLEAARASLQSAKIRLDRATKQMNAAKSKFEAAKKTSEETAATLSGKKDNKGNEELVAELSQSKAQVESLLKNLRDIEDQSDQDKKALQVKVDALKKKLSDQGSEESEKAVELSQRKAEDESLLEKLKDTEKHSKAQVEILLEKLKQQEGQCGRDKKALQEKVDDLKKKLLEKETKVTKTVINLNVFLDITIDGNSAGRIAIELYADTTPRLAEKFRLLCTGEKGVGQNGKPFHYKGTVNVNYGDWLLTCRIFPVRFNHLIKCVILVVKNNL